MRLKVYLVLSFLLSLSLFYVGVQHNPQGEFIDLDTNELDLSYTAVFMSANIAIIFAVALAFELGVQVLIIIGKRLQPGLSALHTREEGQVSNQQTSKEKWKRRLPILLCMSIVPSLLISGVAMYAAYRHNPQEIYFNYETGDVALWACTRFFLRCFIAIFVGLTMVQLALLPIIVLMTRFGDRLRTRSKVL